MRVSRRMAFCGIICGIAVVTMLLSVFPYISVGLSAVAGLTLVPAALEIKTRYGWLCYSSVAVLCFLFVPDAGVKWLFIFFFGYYPIMQLRINLWQNRILAWIVKVLIFNAVCVAAFFFVTYVLGVQDIAILLTEHPVMIVTLPILNALFVVYDMVVWYFIVFYRVRIHPYVSRFLR